jgi:histidine triad (HIT) family protein
MKKRHEATSFNQLNGLKEHTVENCIFCKIVAKQLPSQLLYEDDELMAFHDINPAAPVHFLIIPKQHIASLATATAEQAAVVGRMLLLAPKLAEQAGCGVQIDADGKHSGGFKTAFHVGPAGGQLVYHLHLHVMGNKS